MTVAGATGTSSARTLLSVLAEALSDAAAYNKSEMDPPAVVLWPDRDRQWEKLVPVLRSQLPHLLTLGSFDPTAATGPAIWLKCAIARRLEEPSIPADVVPVLYLPGVSRNELRDVEDCPPEIQPLAELQYRGVWFTQVSNKDWTVRAFLTSREAGLELDIAGDATTRDALQHSLLQLARTPLDQIAGQKVTYDVLNGLVHKDPARAVLDWLDESNGMRERPQDVWASFRSICQKRYDFDPEAEGRLGAAERLGGKQGAWLQVWARYEEAPRNWPRLPELLRKAQPPNMGTLFYDLSAWPKENDTRENALRTALLGYDGLPHAQAIAATETLEKEHGERRAWVWARLGEAPLAHAMAHLARLATLVAKPLAGVTVTEFAEAYRGQGWQADAAVIDALAAVTTSADEQAVRTATRALYLPWLQQAATRFQQALVAAPPARDAHARPVEKATCFLFVDGMRYDIGQRIAAAMRARGWDVGEDWRWAPLPTVTATAKPATSPVANLLTGGDDDAEFNTRVAASGAPLTADRFRQLLGQQGISYLPRTERGDSKSAAWTEIGDIDRRGHDEGARLARRIQESVDDVVARVGELLDAGWSRVRLVTDHGWLLVPGGLPKIHLPAYLTASRWGRCATLKQTSNVEVPVVPWHWSADVRVAIAPGAGVFYEGSEYAHGGATVQEMVVPELVVSRGAAAVHDAKIASVEWVQLRCRVKVEGNVAGLSVDVRLKPADGTTSKTTPKLVPENGQLSLIIPDDDLQGSAAAVVLTDSAGHVVDKQATTIGE